MCIRDSYKIESVEFIQGLILGVTALAAVPYLEQYLGLPYELAWSCVIIETFLYLLHSLLGDPVVPGWITPTLPLTIVSVSYTHLSSSSRVEIA